MSHDASTTRRSFLAGLLGGARRTPAPDAPPARNVPDAQGEGFSLSGFYAARAARGTPDPLPAFAIAPDAIAAAVPTISVGVPPPPEAAPRAPEPVWVASSPPRKEHA